MADSNNDPVALAAARLEAAVDRLATILARPIPRDEAPEGTPAAETLADMVPRAEVVALAEKLDDTIARLRAAIGDAAAEEAGLDDLPDEPAGDEPDIDERPDLEHKER